MVSARRRGYPFLKTETDFHTHRFRRISDILLVLRSDEAETGSASLYARCSDRPLSAEDHQFAALSFPRHTLDGSAVPHVLIVLGQFPNVPRCLQGFKKHRPSRQESMAATDRIMGIWQWFTRAKLPSKAPWQLAKKWMSNTVSALAKVPSRLSISRSTARPNASQPTTSAGTAKSVGTTKIRLLVALVLLLVGFSLSIAFVHFRSAAFHLPYVTPPQSAGTGLHLRLDVQREGILVSWDRDTKAVRSAKNGALLIDDGSQKHMAELEHNELANGSLFYKSTATDLNFRLTIYGSDGSTLTDGVRVLDHSNQLTTAHAATAPSAAVQTASLLNRGPILKSGEQGPSQKKTRTAPANLIAARSSDLTSRPAETAGGFTDRLRAERATALQAFVSPRPIKTVMLNGALFESSLLDGIRQIEVVVDIDEYGRVTAARPLSNDDISPLVAAAAVTAAKQWVFEPARIGSNNVAAKHTIVFRFAQH